MNESMVHHAARAVKQISELGPPSIDEENDRLYAEPPRRTFRVPVTLHRKGLVTVQASDARSAESVARVMAAFAEDIENAVQTESVGKAIEA